MVIQGPAGPLRWPMKPDGLVAHQIEEWLLLGSPAAESCPHPVGLPCCGGSSWVRASHPKVIFVPKVGTTGMGRGIGLPWM